MFALSLERNILRKSKTDDVSVIYFENSKQLIVVHVSCKYASVVHSVGRFARDVYVQLDKVIDIVFIDTLCALMEVLIKTPSRTPIMKRVVNVSDSACCWIFVFNSVVYVYYKNILATNKKCQRVINDVPSRDVLRFRNGIKKLPGKKDCLKIYTSDTVHGIRKGICLARGLLLPITWPIHKWCTGNYIVSYKASFFSINSF